MRQIVTILFLLLQVVCVAQNQSGLVKTLGRPERKGVPLAGVTIRVEESHNAIVTDKDGLFSFSVDRQQEGGFALQQVQKHGYELNDRDVIGRRYAYSSTHPITIVMVSTKQLQADKMRIENNAYAVAEKNFKNKLAALEEQHKNGTINNATYRDQIQSLQNSFEKYQSLIDGLSEHYAHIDYDVLDDNEREIARCIEEGELDRADSLIHQCFDVSDVLRRNMAALDNIEQGITQAKDIIAEADRSMEEVIRRQAKDAEYLYQLYTIALARFDNKKAEQYILTRAELDTTNVQWTIEAAIFISEYKSAYDESISYYNRAERHALQQPEWLSSIYMNKGAIYLEQGKYIEAIQTDSIALELCVKHYGYTAFSTFKSINNMALVLKIMGEPIQALSYYEELYNKLYNIPENIKDIDVGFYATLCNNISTIHSAIGNDSLALKYGHKALCAYKEKGDLLGEALVYCNLGGFNRSLGFYRAASEFYDKSEELYKKILGEGNSKEAWVLCERGKLYSSLGDVREAYHCLKRSLELYRQYYDKNSVVVAEARVNYALVNPNLSEALAQIDSSLVILGKYGEKQVAVADAYCTKAIILEEKEQYLESEKYLHQALSIYNKIFGSNSDPYSARCYANLALTELGQSNFNNALYYVDRVIEICDSIYGDHVENLRIFVLSIKAAILLSQGNTHECKSLCIQIINDCKQVQGYYWSELSDVNLYLSIITIGEATNQETILAKIEEALGFALKAYEYKVNVKDLDDDSLTNTIYQILVLGSSLKQLGSEIHSTSIMDVVKNNPKQVQKILSRMKQ